MLDKLLKAFILELIGNQVVKVKQYPFKKGC